MVSNASDDLPEPDNPVITINESLGKSRSMFFKLCVLAPRMLIVSIEIINEGEVKDSFHNRQGKERIYKFSI